MRKVQLRDDVALKILKATLEYHGQTRKLVGEPERKRVVVRCVGANDLKYHYHVRWLHRPIEEDSELSPTEDTWRRVLSRLSRRRLSPVRKGRAGVRVYFWVEE